ncbi:MAG: hypothetical protein ACLR01_11590 [Vescimonas sp.]
MRGDLRGLPTPRLPSERREGGVFASDGGDVTDAFRRGRRRWCVWPGSPGHRRPF